MDEKELTRQAIAKHSLDVDDEWMLLEMLELI
jgi:hypothetical protein